MEQLGIFLGSVIGVALKHCAPVLVDILAAGIRKSMADTTEDSKVDQDLKKRLLDRIAKSGV